MKKGDTYFLMILMALMLVFIALAMRMPDFSSKFLPLLAGGTVFILAAIALVQEYRKKGKPPPTADAAKAKAATRKSLRAYLAMAGWVGGVTLLVYLAGFIVATLLFVAAYMKSHGIKWVVAISSAVVFTIVIYASFQVAMKIDLYKGLLFTWMGE